MMSGGRQHSWKEENDEEEYPSIDVVTPLGVSSPFDMVHSFLSYTQGKQL